MDIVGSIGGVISNSEFQPHWGKDKRDLLHGRCIGNVKHKKAVNAIL